MSASNRKHEVNYKNGHQHLSNWEKAGLKALLIDQKADQRLQVLSLLAGFTARHPNKRQ
jgi:hypothetical protein